jgi:hypothetical protein
MHTAQSDGVGGDLLYRLREQQPLWCRGIPPEVGLPVDKPRVSDHSLKKRAIPDSLWVRVWHPGRLVPFIGLSPVRDGAAWCTLERS